MATIVTRAGKGSPLTNTEVDANFTNLNDAKIETLTSTDTSVTITGTGASRNLSVPVNPNVVSGPASVTDNAITRFDGTTGKLVQNSSVTIDDNGNAGNVNAITFDTTPGTLPTATGSMFWDTGNGSPSVLLNANTSLQLGQESIALVYNGTGSTIPKGTVVAVSGAQGQRPSVVLADADSEALSAPTLGITAEAIINGAEGFVCTFGLVRGINTSAFTAGAPIYLSQTAGGITATRPTAPAHTVFLGWVISVNASSGELFVNINNGWELDELHNVLITSPASGNTLIYDAVVGVWKNANLTDGTGISITEGAGSITVGLAANYGDTQNPYASKTANNFLAAPNGTAGVPTFRAIVAADIPTLNQNTTGSSGSCTGNSVTATTATTANALNAANSYTAVSFTATSDERLKTNWAGLSLDFVALLAGVQHGTFERISDGTRDVGVSAQSLQKIIPEAVVTNTDGFLSVNYGGAALVAAIELAKVVEELRAEVARLKIKVGE